MEHKKDMKKSGVHKCCSKQKVKRGLWSPDEDEKLAKYVGVCGVGCWTTVPGLAGLQRCGKSCRLRWINYLRPDLKKGRFLPHEATLIVELHRSLGNRWAQMARHLPGRTDNEIKNFWNSSIKKTLLNNLKLSAKPLSSAPSDTFSSDLQNLIRNTNISSENNPVHNHNNNHNHMFVPNNNLFLNSNYINPIIPNTTLNPMYVPYSYTGFLPVQPVQGFIGSQSMFQPLMSYNNLNMVPPPPPSIYIPPSEPTVLNIPSWPEFSYTANPDSISLNVQDPVGTLQAENFLFVSEQETHPMSPLLDNDFYMDSNMVKEFLDTFPDQAASIFPDPATPNYSFKDEIVDEVDLGFPLGQKGVVPGPSTADGVAPWVEGLKMPTEQTEQVPSVPMEFLSPEFGFGFSPELKIGGDEQRLNPSHIKNIESLMVNFSGVAPSGNFPTTLATSPPLPPLPCSGPFWFQP